MGPLGLALVGGGIAAGASILGGMSEAESARAENQRNIDAQREFAQMGIRWRVEDAKAAGLHPLYALGANTPAFSPVISAGTGAAGRGLAEAGQHIGRAISATQTEAEREYSQAQLAAVRASTAKDLAQAQYWASEASRASRPGAAPMPDTVSSVAVESHPVALNTVKPKADERISVRSNNPSVTAAPDKPFFSEYLFSGGNSRAKTRILLPQSDEGPGEALENVPWYLWPSIIARNMEEYGPSWITQFLPGGNRPLVEPAPSRPGAPTRLWKGQIK